MSSQFPPKFPSKIPLFTLRTSFDEYKNCTRWWFYGFMIQNSLKVISRAKKMVFFLTRLCWSCSKRFFMSWCALRATETINLLYANIALPYSSARLLSSGETIKNSSRFIEFLFVIEILGCAMLLRIIYVALHETRLFSLCFKVIASDNSPVSSPNSFRLSQNDFR